MSETGSNLDKSSVNRLVNNLVDDIITKVKRNNKTIKRNPKLNYNRSVSSVSSKQ